MYTKWAPFLGIVGLAVMGGPALAGVSAEEAKQLGTSLTAFGAEKAGNADGSIPAYEGGLAAMKGLPPGNAAKGSYPDPFANEKPSLQISQQNMAQYADMLTEGTKVLLQRYPDFHLNVYPTHRTASYPDWVIKNTLHNATSAHMIGEADGVADGFGGIPFPIPKSGAEVLWNNNLRWNAPSYYNRFDSYVVDAAGGVTDLGEISSWNRSSWYDQSKTTIDGPDLSYWQNTVLFHSPVTQAGTATLYHFPIDYSKFDQMQWIYTPGQRRVRVAPEFKYDTPSATYGGAVNYDEFYMFRGAADKFTFKLLGKKEMFIPYNNYRIQQTTERSQLLGDKHLNSDVPRWEKHRVWVVEATLKPGERHACSKLRLYFDEDTWMLFSRDSYDQSGTLYRSGMVYQFLSYPDPIALVEEPYTMYDFTKGSYLLAIVYTTPTAKQSTATYDVPPSSPMFVGSGLAGLSAR